MKRVLWVCNIVLPAIAKELQLPYSNREGWLSGIFEQLIRKEGEEPFVLGVCFPLESLAKAPVLEKPGGFALHGIPCYAFLEDLGCPERYEPSMEQRFAEIYQDFKPDIVHIFGTEFPHALAAVRSFQRPDKTLVGIQGLCSEIGKVYMAGLPEYVKNRVTFRDLIRKDSIKQQQEKFFIRGKNEAEALRGSLNITGRTAFDKKGTESLNPKARYFSMNETMRREFYTGSWKLSLCEEHSIFLAQGDYPLKGMHFVLEAMAELICEYPDMKLYVAGNSIIENKSWKQKLKLSSYGKYLLELMKRYELTERVVMLGKLTAEEMKKQFLKSSVFVCASVLENSPNTVAEAMLLGVPVAASKTGGIPDMLEDEKEGLLFEKENASALAEAVKKLWSREKDKEGLCLSQRLSMEAAKRARMTHDGEKNYLRLLEIYKEIGEEA